MCIRDRTGTDTKEPETDSAFSAKENEQSASWPTVTPPRGEDEAEPEFPVEEEAIEPAGPIAGAQSQVGEAVIREVLGGELISETVVDEEQK